MTGFFKWLLAGSIGGLVGAAIWAGISYATNYEIGWIAWGIGAMVGYCVGYVAQDSEDGLAPGLTAGVLAIGAVLLGKFAAAHFLAASFAGGLNIPPVVPDDMIAHLADDMAKDRMAKGQSVNFPPGQSIETASKQADYPPDVWQAAAQQWSALTPAEQQKQMAARNEEMKQMTQALGGAMRQSAFLASFGIFDALWFFLAAGTAYKLGSGTAGDDD